MPNVIIVLCFLSFQGPRGEQGPAGPRGEPGVKGVPGVCSPEVSEYSGQTYLPTFNVSVVNVEIYLL